MNKLISILRTRLAGKRNKEAYEDISDFLKDASILKKLAKNVSQEKNLNKLYQIIDNIALELSHLSIKPERQKILLNRLDKMLEMIDKFQNPKFEFSSIISSIVSIKLTDFKRRANSLSSNEIVNWLNQYRSFIPSKDYIEQLEYIRKKSLCENLNTVAPNNVLQCFKQSVDIENMNLLEINVFFDWYNKNRKNISDLLESQVQEILQLGKRKILEQIYQETRQEANNLLLEHAELPKLLSEGEISLLGRGGNGIILESEEANTVLKIFYSNNTQKHILSEVKNHADFLDAIAEGKRQKKIPDWIHIPNIVQIPNFRATDIRERAYIMDRIDGITLKRWIYLKLNEYREKLEPFMISEIRAISEVEFEKLVKKRQGDMASYYNIYPQEGELLPEVFFKAFENNTDKKIGLHQTLKYLKEEHHLVHDDLHWKNILIDAQEEIYLIDFGC
jgi:hypothetical protein